jgi:hypothetical protein
MTDISNGNPDRKVIIMLDDIDCLALYALSYAKGLSNEIILFSAIARQEKEEELRAKWDSVNSDIPYIIQYSKYKSAGTLLSEFLESSEDRDKPEEIIVLVPLVIMKGWLQRYLNYSFIKQLKLSFIDRDNIILFELPYYLDQST